VIKVIWGGEWDPLIENDRDGLLVKRMGEVVDGEYQRYAVESGAYVRDHFWGAHPTLRAMVDHLSDEDLKKLTLGGHDPVKVYAAYKAAVDHTGQLYREADEVERWNRHHPTEPPRTPYVARCLGQTDGVVRLRQGAARLGWTLAPQSVHLAWNGWIWTE
jgi:pyruvate dehydrogenase complex dehydrogenase (E1) component